jgi:hypothetical protein
MRYAIVINLDYISHPYDSVHLLWGEIREALLAVGFRLEGRLFTIDLPAALAKRLATQVIENLEGHLPFERKHVYAYIREFYGFELGHADNLLLPPADAIEVHGRAA